MRPTNWLPRPRPLPGLLIPGAMKGGTTSLFRYLAAHPQLAPAPRKEVHFFDRHFQRGPGWYRRPFARGRRPDAIPFESTPYLMFEPRAPDRVRGLIPEARLVFLLRDPVDRAFSHYHNNRRLGREPLDFASALDAEDDRTLREEERLLAEPRHVSWPHRLYSYRRRGLYAEQLLRWRARFPTAQMLVVDSGRLFADPAAVISDVLDFLGLEPWQPGSLAPSNEGRHGERLSAPMRRRLEAWFAPYQQRLVDLIGWCPTAGDILPSQRSRAA